MFIARKDKCISKTALHYTLIYKIDKTKFYYYLKINIINTAISPYFCKQVIYKYTTYKIIFLNIK